MSLNLEWNAWLLVLLVILFQIGPSFLSKNKSSHYNCSQPKPRDRGERNFCPRLLLGRTPVGKNRPQAQRCSRRFMVHTDFSLQWEKPQVCRTPDVLHQVLLTSPLSPKAINNLTLFLNCMCFSPPLTEPFSRFLSTLVCPTQWKGLWICFEIITDCSQVSYYYCIFYTSFQTFYTSYLLIAINHQLRQAGFSLCLLSHMTDIYFIHFLTILEP